YSVSSKQYSVGQCDATVHWILFTGHCSLDIDQMILPPPFSQDKEAAVYGLGESGHMRHIAHPLVVEVDPPALYRPTRVGLRTGEPAFDKQIDYRQSTAQGVAGHLAGRYLGKDILDVGGIQPG